MANSDNTQVPHLFLCHSHEDKPFVRRLARDLGKLSIEAWLDERELRIGDSLHRSIGDAIEASAYFAVLLSPDSTKSKWCRDELEQALTREKRIGRKFVLPLLYRRVQAPPFVEGRLHVNFSRSYLKGLAELAGFILEIHPGTLCDKIADHSPKTIADVDVILKLARDPLKNTVVLSEDDYSTLQTFFDEKLDVKIDSRATDITLNDRDKTSYDVILLDSVMLSTDDQRGDEILKQIVARRPTITNVVIPGAPSKKNSRRKTKGKRGRPSEQNTKARLSKTVKGKNTKHTRTQNRTKRK